MFKSYRVQALRAAGLLFAAFVASAAFGQITLFNTGLSGPGNPDPNWALTQVLPGPGPLSGPQAVTLSPGNYFPGGGGFLPYVADDAHSRWVADQDSTSNPGTFGNVYYSQNFVSANTSGVITGRYAAADVITNVFIDGIPVGTDGAGAGPISYAGNQGDPWDQWHAFNYAGALIPGLNTISFEITSPDTSYNGFNAQFGAVPEPASCSMLFGVLGIGLASFRRRRK